MACEVRSVRVHLLGRRAGVELCGKYDGHDDAVDGDDFAEDDRDEHLIRDAGGADAGTEDACRDSENTPTVERLFVRHSLEISRLRGFGGALPCCADNRQADAKTDSYGCEPVRAYRLNDPADLFVVSLSCSSSGSSRKSCRELI